MVIIKFNILLLITIFHVCHCERRIIDGEQVTSDKSYAVYLVKAKSSSRPYDSWLCGGALVSKDFIITSAACVEDVRYMYAIAGYRKYVHDKNIELDECTKEMKKRIVYTCVPVSYEFDFDRIEKWAYVDIALVKVESPYVFVDARYQLMCSYIPTIIPINYSVKRQAPNLDVMVLGWGHKEYWREKDDLVNYNQDYQRFASTTILDKKTCQEAYKDYAELTNIIEKYMICSMGTGHLSDHGIPSMKIKPKSRTGCITQEQKSMGIQGEVCKEDVSSEQTENVLMNLMYKGDETRKRMILNEKTNNITNINVNGTGFVKGTDNDNGTDILHGIDIVNGTDDDNGADIANGTDIVNETDSIDRTDFIYKPGFGKISGYFNRSFTRRGGICQNDHGGPLVTWVGKKEVLIGIASVFKITANNKCIGPFLYTSTVCSGAFLGCILGDRRANVLRGRDMSVNTSTALFCDSPPSVKGFDTIESYVSWKDHPAGPADNEKNTGGRLVANVKNDQYATNVKEQHPQDTNDRFSLRIALPAGMRPPPIKRQPLRKRPPLRKIPPPKREPPPIIGSPQEMEPPQINSPPIELAPPPNTKPLPEMEPPSIIRPPLEMVPKQTIRSPPNMRLSPIIKPQTQMLPPQMESPIFDEILNVKEEVFVKKPFEIQQSFDVQSGVQMRPQSPLHG